MSDKPTRGDYQRAPSTGWQHGPVPKAPEGLKDASVVAWTTWFGAWYAAHWTPADLPQIRVLILLHDQIERGEYQRASEFRLLADTMGVTPKGQQDRRWLRPGDDGSPVRPPAPGSQYGHLRAVK